MISKSKVKSVLCDGVFVFNYFKTMYDKTIIRFGFCDIRINQGLVLSALAFRTADKLTSTLIIPDKLSQKPHPIIVYYYAPLLS